MKHLVQASREDEKKQALTRVGVFCSWLFCEGRRDLGAGVGDVGEVGDLGWLSSGEPFVKGLRKGLGFFSVGDPRCRKGFVLEFRVEGEAGGSENGLKGLEEVEACSETPFSEGSITLSSCPLSPHEK